ncbi:helix-turn-helix transcriptional regulator [Mycobacteroides chelonae]|nr:MULTISPECIES: helix-turn-helix transcriptional regulator [Mycobacteroides]MBN7314512.1 helix-turn-helix transcriptional regulator [Mycobacteroides abscessus subsp. abscessus]MBV6362595.1 helix-turn-helix transcriptional regulator [Mycobacteroides chelonae]RIU14696.1 XRE family transcriptional regulator [Mycobacteroides abscessus]
MRERHENGAKYRDFLGTLLNMDDVQLGIAVRQAREERNVTVRSLASDIGMDWSALSRSEIGKRSFKAVELVAISHALDIPLDELVGTSITQNVAARTANQAGHDMMSAIARWLTCADTSLTLYLDAHSKHGQTPLPWVQSQTGTKLPDSKRIRVSDAKIRDLLGHSLAELTEKFVLEAPPVDDRIEETIPTKSPQ